MTFTSDISLGSIITIGSVLSGCIGVVWSLAAYNNRSDNRYQANKRAGEENKGEIEKTNADIKVLKAYVENMDRNGSAAINQRLTELLARVVMLETNGEQLRSIAIDMKQIRADMDAILKFFPREFQGIKLPGNQAL